MKYCDKCGAQIPEGSLACPACSTPVTVLPVTNVQPTYAPDQTPVTPVEQLTPVAPAAPVTPVQQPVQPAYTQPVAPVTPAQPKQKSAGIPIVVAIILLVIVAVSGLLLGRVFFGSADCKEKQCEIVTNVDTDDEIDDTQHNVNPPSDEEEEEDEPTQVGASKEAYISGHKFTIPSEYYYEVDTE